MSKSRLEFKVGLFVLVCLLLFAGLMLQFGKGTTFFRPTYMIKLKATNVGGLKMGAQVLMSGVQVGTVSRIELVDEGKSVIIDLKVYKRYFIRKNAQFDIESAGFLGDQYVAIYPQANEGEFLGPNDLVTAQEPFNIQEVARSAASFIKHVDDAVAKLNAAISDVRKYVLNEQTLTNLSNTISTLRQVSDDAAVTVNNVNELIISNQVPVTEAVSNLMVFSRRLDAAAESVQGILDTNITEIAAAISNVQNSTAILTNLLGGVQAGHGLAGSLFKSEDLSGNFSTLTSNLMVTSSNLNSLGLWRVIWGPRHRDEVPISAATQDTHGRTIQ